MKLFFLIFPIVLIMAIASAAGTRSIVPSGDGGVFGNYYLYSEIRQEAINLQGQYPAIMKFDSLGIRSIENRALYLIKVSNSPGANNGKPEVLISGAIHAYEPIGPSVAMSDIMHLAHNYAVNPEIQWLVNNRQIYVIPVMNPDGYVYNETYPGRMWRKNRRYNANGSYGVDLNRNYPYKWGYDDVGSSPNPSAWNYRGTEPASEPETQSVIDFINDHNIRTWHNHHSPNDVLLIPFGYINSYPWSDTLEFYTICRAESVLYGFNDWGNSYQAYGYLVNGGMEDWAWCDSATYKIYGLVPEIGPDYWGGLNDTNVIVQICQNILPAELYLMKIAGFYPESLNIAVVDTFPGGNNNGVLNPGEDAALQIRISNIGVVDTAVGLTGLLRCTDGNLRIIDSTADYGDVIRLSRALNTDPFIVACSSAATPNSWIDCSLIMSWDGGEFSKMIPCSVYVGAVTGIADNHGRVKDIGFSRTIFRNIFDLHFDRFENFDIYDISGRKLWSRANGINDFNIDLNSGVYILQWSDNQHIFRQKIVVIE